ncbi:hypothetical protein GARC_4927 [Paraglaciecola arctica BSs20135]|uniref:Uncharacterized protein n=1 Tax=Paraglaciecola arctica BSs20135 TaxID=493475 RepID=K6YYP0_9ALTE|nr:hypothetical protein GARC_4927 [Paraglaciecola arctica BSs20135]
MLQSEALFTLACSETMTAYNNIYSISEEELYALLRLLPAFVGTPLITRGLF